MDQEKYNEYAAAIRAGRVVVCGGRRAVSLEDLNWIAGLKENVGENLQLVNPVGASKGATTSETDDPDSITVTKQEFQAALDGHTKPLNGIISAQETKITAQAVTIDGLNTQVSALQADNATLKTENETIVSANAGLAKQNDALQAQLDALKNAVPPAGATATAPEGDAGKPGK